MTIVTLLAFLLAYVLIVRWVEKKELTDPWTLYDWISFGITTVGVFLYNYYPQKRRKVCKNNDL